MDIEDPQVEKEPWYSDLKRPPPYRLQTRLEVGRQKHNFKSISNAFRSPRILNATNRSEQSLAFRGKLVKLTLSSMATLLRIPKRLLSGAEWLRNGEVHVP